MSSPLPVSPTPYIGTTTLITAPTGIDWYSIPIGDDVTPAQNQAEWSNMCARATARADEYCNQVLRATLDYELQHGPDARLTVGPAGGGSVITPYWSRAQYNARVILERWPILQVSSVLVCPSNTWPRTWQTVPTGYYEPEHPPIGIYGSVAPSNAVSGGQSILIAPGYINWDYGRNGYAVQVSYINGWPHCGITQYATAGSATLTVDDTTGWAITNYYATATGATGTVKDAGQQEVLHVTAATTTSGPGTLSLSTATLYPHQTGTIFTTLPSTVEQACIWFAAAEALTRGATTTTIHDIGGHAQQTGGDVTGLCTEAELLLRPFKRTV